MLTLASRLSNMLFYFKFVPPDFHSWLSFQSLINQEIVKSKQFRFHTFFELASWNTAVKSLSFPTWAWCQRKNGPIAMVWILSDKQNSFKVTRVMWIPDFIYVIWFCCLFKGVKYQTQMCWVFVHIIKRLMKP